MKPVIHSTRPRPTAYGVSCGAKPCSANIWIQSRASFRSATNRLVPARAGKYSPPTIHSTVSPPTSALIGSVATTLSEERPSSVPARIA